MPARARAVAGEPQASPKPASARPTALLATRASPPVLPERTAVLVRYVGGAPVRIAGAATGRHYDFRPTSPLRLVAREDALTLLASPSFRLA